MPRIAPLEPPCARYPGHLQRHRAARRRVLFAPGGERAGVDPSSRRFLLDRGPLSLRDRELVIDRTCALAGCEYEWGVHMAIFAEPAGLTPQEVAATAGAGAAAPGWSAAERALLTAVEALDARATLSGGEFAALRAHYDEAQILEVLLLCGFYRMVAYIANGLDLPLEPGAARFAD